MKSQTENSVGFHSTHNPVVINWNDDMDRASEKMLVASSRYLPVVDDVGAIVGILSDQNMRPASIKDQTDWRLGKNLQPSFDPNSRVRDLMSYPVFTIDEGKSVGDAARLMIENNISAVIVCRDHLAVGIVTTQDLLRTLVDQDKDQLTNLRDRLMAAVYNSPLPGLAQNLSDIGV